MTGRRRRRGAGRRALVQTTADQSSHPLIAPRRSPAQPLHAAPPNRDEDFDAASTTEKSVTRPHDVRATPVSAGLAIRRALAPRLLSFRHIVLTHGHVDHAGSGADMIARTGARSYAHAADADLITKGQAEHPGTTVTPGLGPRLVYIKPGGTKFAPFNVDQPSPMDRSCRWRPM